MVFSFRYSYQGQSKQRTAMTLILEGIPLGEIGPHPVGVCHALRNPVIIMCIIHCAYTRQRLSKPASLKASLTGEIHQ